MTRPTVRSADPDRLRDYPPPFPNGWYALARSSDVRDRPVTVRAVGRELVLFRRSSDGVVACVDAHCPHMGAHLGLGAVRGDCIECPFHRWRFDAEGSVAHVPYAASVPASHRTRAHPVDELHGFVCVYLEADDRSLAPPYRLKRLTEIDEGSLVYRGELDAGNVAMHIVEFAENSVDHRHFAPLHGRMRLPFVGLPIPFLGVRHEASWELDPLEPHVSWFHDHAVLEAFGNVVPNTGAHASIRLDGPGSVVFFDFEVRKLGRIVLFQTHTPLEPMLQHVRFRWYAEARVPRLLVMHVVGSWIAQWKQDIAIWETKVYRKRPLLVREDGPVHALRKWYSQFYAPRDVDASSGTRDSREAREPRDACEAPAVVGGADGGAE